MHKSKLEPGVSGKTLHGDSWFHSDEYQIIEALRHSPEVDVDHIRIAAQNGTVELTGTCSDHKEERAIIDIIENVSGVRRVVSHLDVLSDRG